MRCVRLAIPLSPNYVTIPQSATLPAPFTQGSRGNYIAKYIGSAREVVSRMLKYFVTEGLVSHSRSDGIKILDKKALRALAT